MEQGICFIGNMAVNKLTLPVLEMLGFNLVWGDLFFLAGSVSWY